METKDHGTLADALKYSGLALPLIATAVWFAGPHHPVTGSAVIGSGFARRFVIVHALLAGAVVLQGCRFRWFLQQKLVGWLLLGAGFVYGVAIFGFVFGW